MTVQEKLLLNALSAMYPHGVVLHFDSKVGQDDEALFSIRDNGNKYLINDSYYLSEVKPYLRPMSSMTEEEWASFRSTMIKEKQRNYPDSCDFSVTTYYSYTAQTFDWLNENKFDYRGLIPKGLALEAPKGMYN